MEFSFSLLEQNVFFAAASILLLGFFFGRLANKLGLPRVPGYIFAGIIFGPNLLRLLSEKALVSFDFFPQFALGIIALIIGAGLNFQLIKRLGLGLILITLLESLGAFVVVFFLLLFFKAPLIIILPLAAISAATAPAGTIAIIREYRASGPLTETILAVVALDDAVAIVLFGLVLTLNVEHMSNFGSTALASLSTSMLEILAATVIGIVLGGLTTLLLKTTKEISDSFVIVLGMLLLGIGIASVSNVSALLTNMFLGLTLINLYAKTEELLVNLERLTPPIYCIFFVLAGTHLNFNLFITGGSLMLIWSSLFVVARIFGKITGAYLGAIMANASVTVKKYLGLTLIPQAGVAIGLSLLIGQASGYFEYRTMIINIVLISIVFSDGLIGPICTKYALFKSGEARAKD
ncbi:hypothetical protein COT42_07005 [Candidatus Saganbacteria bacterium CG08_land_8_20_14_0_20_45_16]|uniref:Cation/H+ exchanger transmembrane domain-containing protein n=1 Tax=Candidatus Saganbacteria bacterium CG08_land_8_20_14_0_20_45_16 TaxID=2014293 RepID=A0A2H0XV53_UNCSA|nr:MAG: hypothetical protein COT42_07005 [Candidatus Saganbacteria bacterium CG08_land_8_20_14_0_20_45_16]